MALFGRIKVVPVVVVALQPTQNELSVRATQAPQLERNRQKPTPQKQPPKAQALGQSSREQRFA
jgi:hypothetical protein